MEGYWGFDIKTRTYYYKVEYLGYLAGEAKGLTKEQLTKFKKSFPANWRKDINMLH